MKIQGLQYGSDGGWEAAYESVAFTAAAIAAHPTDPELTRLGGRVRPLLGDWETIEADRHRLRRAVIAAHARAQVADALLDDTIEAFARDLLAEVGGDTSARLYKRFFTEPHEDVIALGLDSELPTVTLLVLALDKNDDVPAKLRAHLEPLRAGLKLGNGALADRSDAFADLGRHNARVEAWQESADSALRSVRRALGRLATEQKRGAGWTEAFFAQPG